MDDSAEQLLQTLRKDRDLRRTSENYATKQLGTAREILEVTVTACKQMIPTLGYADEMLRVLIADARRVTAAEIDFDQAVAGREAMDKLIAAIEADRS
jgi:hypothetical protein